MHRPLTDRRLPKRHRNGPQPAYESQAARQAAYRQRQKVKRLKDDLAAVDVELRHLADLFCVLGPPVLEVLDHQLPGNPKVGTLPSTAGPQLWCRLAQLAAHMEDQFREQRRLQEQLRYVTQEASRHA
jgi:hypothetical protein